MKVLPFLFYMENSFNIIKECSSLLFAPIALSISSYLSNSFCLWVIGKLWTKSCERTAKISRQIGNSEPTIFSVIPIFIGMRFSRRYQSFICSLGMTTVAEAVPASRSFLSVHDDNSCVQRLEAHLFCLLFEYTFFINNKVNTSECLVINVNSRPNLVSHLSI